MVCCGFVDYLKINRFKILEEFRQPVGSTSSVSTGKSSGIHEIAYWSLRGVNLQLGCCTTCKETSLLIH
jgi:hypothetical protein